MEIGAGIGGIGGIGEGIGGTGAGINVQLRNYAIMQLCNHVVSLYPWTSDAYGWLNSRMVEWWCCIVVVGSSSTTIIL